MTLPPVLTGLFAAIALTASLSPAVSAGLLKPDDTQMTTRGTAVYSEHCASCHGKALEGEPDWRNRKADGKLPAPPHDETGHTWHHADRVLFALVKDGLQKFAGDDYRTDMPAYGDVLSDEDILAVLSYIKSQWPAEIRERHDTLNAQAQ